MASIAPQNKQIVWRLPVCYDTNLETDLEEVSNALNLSIPQIIALHTSTAYTIYAIGYLPGFMYSGAIPQALAIPKKITPRVAVKKGAVGIANAQTGVYPQDGFGSWHILGNCAVPMFDVQKETPCFLTTGDQIKFYEVSRAAYELQKIEAAVGIYVPNKTLVDA